MENQRLTEVRPVILLLQSTVNPLAAKSVLLFSCPQKPFWNNQEDYQVIDKGLEPSSSANIRAGLKYLKDCSKPPMPLCVPKAVEWLPKSKIANEIKQKEMIPGHDIDRGFPPSYYLSMELVDHETCIALDDWFLLSQCFV